MPDRSMPTFHIALLQPEIGPNAGNIGRLCLGLGAHLHLVHPLGFQTDEKAVRRAGLDYWKHVSVTEHASTDAFWEWNEERPFSLFSAHGSSTYMDAPFEPGHVLVFGCESVGLPKSLVAQHGAWKIPMLGPTRSLNLSNAVAVVAYGALHKMNPTLVSSGTGKADV